jgi:hypothetical protein
MILLSSLCLLLGLNYEYSFRCLSNQVTDFSRTFRPGHLKAKFKPYCNHLRLRIRGGDVDSDLPMSDAEGPTGQIRKPSEVDINKEGSFDSEEAEQLRAEVLADLDGLEEAARLLAQETAQARAEGDAGAQKLRAEAEKLVAAGPRCHERHV